MEKIKNFLFKNTSTKQTIAKNTFWLFFGEILGRILKLAVLVFATRVLGVEGWGVFSYALAFVSLFYIFADIGINTFITRELSKQDGDGYKYLSASLVLKIFLLLLSFIASLILIPHFSSIHLSLKIIGAFALLNFSDSIREFALSVNRAMQKMEREAFVKILMNGVITILGIILLILHPNPLSLAIAYALGSIIASLVTIWIVYPAVKTIEWEFPFSFVKTILNFAWPFIATTIFMGLIANIDTIMLGQLRSAAEVGLYAASERVVQFLAIIPIFIAMATFPLMSQTEGDPETSSRIFEKTMVLLLMIGFPLTIGGMLFGSNIITVLFGQTYLAGGIVLTILMVSLLADFPNILLGNIIFAKNLQKKFILATGFGLIINIALNLYLIPRYGAIGAAFSTVASQLLIMGINWLLLKKYLSFSVMPKTGKIVGATVGMTIIIWGCHRIGVHFVGTVLLAIMSYGGMLWVMKESSLKQLLALITRPQ